MILEIAVLNVELGETANFESAFAEAQGNISSMKGYLSHELKRCLEVPDQYVLLVRWETLEDHTEEFRGSPQYQEWKSLLHHFYSPFPTVEHYEDILGLSSPLA